MGFIKKWMGRRAQKRKLRELQAFASGFRTMDVMEEKGLLAWNTKSRQLFIDRSLAYVMMHSASSWTNFINNVFLWQYSKECSRAWGDYFLKEELSAVRQAKKDAKGRVLSRADIDRIREARRMEILQSDLEAPKVDGFEFFVVAPSTDVGSAPSGKPVGRLVSVGHYDPDTGKMEMALWSEVEPLLNQQA